ncbi:nuclear transport factor 2 family protein [Chitinophaga solisilvae]|uniref:Nuclear transport factor 2 family protein n=1 Tax=Chitinophaga solisilvae TaxID=1233460 RepID=A0A433WBJ1_9BACT|nr:nuclear transport factor 2 family protein [Chitinophaga solisilvae]NSL86802.1 nuclear transport factor 2 family protein [Chitinophaga solisilvae]
MLSELQQVLEDYQQGIFQGDTNRLKNAFHPQALLAGDINGAEYFKTVAEYLEIVSNRKSPRENGEPFRMKVIHTEMLGNNAIVKLHVPILGYNYTDYLSLAVIGGRWQIVSKVFAQ